MLLHLRPRVVPWDVAVFGAHKPAAPTGFPRQFAPFVRCAACFALLYCTWAGAVHIVVARGKAFLRPAPFFFVVVTSVVAVEGALVVVVVVCVVPAGGAHGWGG